MNWPVPLELLLSAPQRVWDWDADGNASVGESTVRRYLDSLRIQEGRVVLMAKEHEKLRPGLKWEKEPWYDTDYNVERFDENFIKEVCDILRTFWAPIIMPFARQTQQMILRSYSYQAPMLSYQPIWTSTSVKSQRYSFLMI